MLYASDLGVKADRDNERTCFDALMGTLPLVRVFPSADTVTFKVVPKVSVKGDAPVIREYVMGVSTRMDTAVGSSSMPWRSSDRYGRIACPQRRASSGVADLSGAGN